MMKMHNKSTISNGFNSNGPTGLPAISGTRRPDHDATH